MENRAAILQEAVRLLEEYADCIKDDYCIAEIYDMPVTKIQAKKTLNEIRSAIINLKILYED